MGPAERSGCPPCRRSRTVRSSSLIGRARCRSSSGWAELRFDVMPDGYPALQLANLVFGGYFSSRWNENIREDKGYTYGPHSRIEHNVLGSSSGARR